MLPEKYRRLWRRRLRRRPLLPFLLAATLAVDVLIAASVAFHTDAISALAGISFLLAQIGLIAAWSLHTSRWVAHRLLIALGLSVALGWWFLVNGSDDLLWFPAFVLAVDLLVLVGVNWFRHRKQLSARRRRYGIGSLLAWTTLAAVAVTVLRSVDTSQDYAVFQHYEVWSGLVVDAFIVVLALAIVSRGWSVVTTILLTGLGSALLLAGSLAVSEIIQLGLYYRSNQVLIEEAHSILSVSAAYHATFVATILVWTLGLRHLGDSSRQASDTTADSEPTVEPVKPIDLTA